MLQVKGDDAVLASVREAIATDRRTPCLEQVSFNSIEKEQTQEQLDALFDQGLWITSTGQPKHGVSVEVAVADGAVLNAIAAAVDRPDIVHVEAQAFAVE